MGNKRVKYRQLLSPFSPFSRDRKNIVRNVAAETDKTEKTRRKEERSSSPFPTSSPFPLPFFLPSFEKGKTGHPFTTLIFQHVHPIQLNVREKKGGGVWIIPTKKKKKGRGGKGASTSHYLFQSKLKLVR